VIIWYTSNRRAQAFTISFHGSPLLVTRKYDSLSREMPTQLGGISSLPSKPTPFLLPKIVRRRLLGLKFSSRLRSFLISLQKVSSKEALKYCFRQQSSARRQVQGLRSTLREPSTPVCQFFWKSLISSSRSRALRAPQDQDWDPARVPLLIALPTESGCPLGARLMMEL
jgi:hypothetical protein